MPYNGTYYKGVTMEKNSKFWLKRNAQAVFGWIIIGATATVAYKLGQKSTQD